MNVVFERERDGDQLNADGLRHSVILGDLHLELNPASGVVRINGERWRVID